VAGKVSDKTAAPHGSEFIAFLPGHSFELWLTQTLLKDFGKDAAGQLPVAFHAIRVGSIFRQRGVFGE
jgi:hypothetical protein